MILENNKTMYCNCEEKWKILKQNNNYKISSKGRIKSKFRKSISTGYSHIKVRDKGKNVTNNYRRFRPQSKGKAHLIHNLVMTNFVGDYPADMDIDHKNQIKAHNCMLCNLEYLSISDNQKNKEWKNKKGYIRKNNTFLCYIDKKPIKIKNKNMQEAKDLQDCYICIQDLKEQVFTNYQNDLLNKYN